MVVMCTALPVIMSRLMCMWGPFAPIRERLVRKMEDWAYNKKAVTVEIIVNIVFVLLSVLLLVCTAAENPNVPVRVWVAVHTVQCLVHVILVWSEYSRVDRRRRRRGELHLDERTANEDAGFFPSFVELVHVSFSYSWEFFNMSVSFVWSNVGMEWLKAGDKLLRQNAPCLYWWFTRAYLACDVFFAIIWLAGFTACCCLPCVIVILRYRVRIVPRQKQEGALEADLKLLPKYRFHMSRNLKNPNVDAGVIVPMDTNGRDMAAKRVVLPEDSECCICLCSYDDGIELHVLPCNHHFHATCIEKWLKINAKCPVCKYNILTRSV